MGARLEAFFAGNRASRLLEESLAPRKGLVQVTGLPRGACLLCLQRICAVARPLLILAEEEQEARAVWQILSENPEGPVFLFPPAELLACRTMAQRSERTRERLATLGSLREEPSPAVVTTLRGLMEYQVPREILWEGAIPVRTGEQIPPRRLADRLLRLGYQEAGLVEEAGQCSWRGGLIDVFPVRADDPLRIEFFGDTVETIRRFDSGTQRSIGTVSSFSVGPAREVLLDGESIHRGIQALETQLAAVRDLAPEALRRLRDEVSQDLEMLRDGQRPDNADRWKNLFYGTGDSLLDYFPEKPLLVTREPARLLDAFRKEHRQWEEETRRVLEEGQVLPSFGQLLERPERARSLLAAGPQVAFSLLPPGPSGAAPRDTVAVAARRVPGYLGKSDLLLEDLKRWTGEGREVYLGVADPTRRRNLVHLLQDHHISYRLDPRTPEGVPGIVTILDESVEEGFELPGDRWVCLGEREIFAVARAARRRPETGRKRAIRAFAEIGAGDYVVHDQHGVGRYRGMTSLETGGVRKDYLEIEYGGEDRLYVPADRLDVLEKYVGAQGSVPRLNRLGTRDWEAAKTRARKAVREIAIDLLKLYARRRLARGYAFGEDTAWQREFEDNFPYEETPDQAAAIEDTKRDMEAPHPMDRLIIGDVGYGKTEVALRAAFKAVSCSKQVALLVPTTVLSRQHFGTFQDRFSGWPVRLAVLNRFTTPARAREILRDAAAGRIDILIGTHRLLSADVRFSDLGLVIVDEEQKFGVAHKEKLKEMREETDFLTLTATPIPRTLHLALSGARDLSVIETPPEDRRPVETFVLEYDESLIGHAVRRELERGGQVYYVCTRIRDMERTRQRLLRLVPGVRIATIHGQMESAGMESAMIGFLEGDADLLLSTTIIENGIDIGNVNTLLVDNADRMGLSQLYQLRGRVGRSSRAAYAYFMYRREALLGQEAQERLLAVKEFTELGAGFKIAMRDLEIRGAGNILGAQQHGHMAAVGFEMYTRLLEEEMVGRQGREVKQEEEREPVQIQLSVEAHIPDSYIGLPGVKMDLYQRILRSTRQEQIRELSQETQDRFGPLPDPVRDLFQLSRVRLAARELPLVRIASDPAWVRLVFQGSPAGPESLLQLGEALGREVLVSPGDDLVIRLRRSGRPEAAMLPVVARVLEILGEGERESPDTLAQPGKNMHNGRDAKALDEGEMK